MARLTDEQQNEIKKKYNVDRLWSWSRMNTFLNSKYEQKKTDVIAATQL